MPSDFMPTDSEPLARASRLWDDVQRQATPVPIAWHEGGAGLCDVCGANSNDRSIVRAYKPKRLCPSCGHAFVEGDDRTVAAVFLITPDDLGDRAAHRRRGVGR
jgi:hypothetical protein